MSLIELSPYDKFFQMVHMHLQVAVHVKDPMYIAPLLEKAKKIAVGTQLKLQKDKLIFEKADVPIFRLPDNFSSMRDACGYMYMNHTRPINEALASIGANKDTIVINSHHLCCDGGMLVEMFNALKGEKEYDQPKTLENVFKVFPEEIERATKWPKIDINDENLARFTPKDKGMPFVSMYTQKSTGFDTTPDKLKVYDKKTGKVHGLTDAFYSYMVLTTSVMNGKFKETGVKTMINMRKYMKKPADFSNGAILSKVTLSAPLATPDTTIKDFMKMYRKDFNNILKNGEHFGFLKHYEDSPDKNKMINGTFSILTNVGQFRLGGPIDDVAICTNRFSPPVPALPALSVLHYAVIGKNRNDLYTRISYQPLAFTAREADMFVGSIRYGLENIDLNKTIKEARQMIKNYQDQFIKYQYPKYLI